MIPEIAISCAEQRLFLNSITVEQYKKYVDLMQKNKSNKVTDSMFYTVKILQSVFGNQMSLEEWGQTDVNDFLFASKTIHFIMQDIIPRKLMEITDESPVEQQKSAFDEYDIENGYEEEQTESDEWEICKENVERIIKTSIRVLNDSYSQCMKEDIIELIDYLKFELKTIEENRI